MAAANLQPPIADEIAHALFRVREATPQPAGMEQLTAAIERLAREITSMGQELKAEIGGLRAELRAEVQALRCQSLLRSVAATRIPPYTFLAN